MYNKIINFIFISIAILGISIITLSCPADAADGEEDIPSIFTKPYFSYKDITIFTNSAVVISPTWTNNSDDATYTYSITPTLPEGIAIDADTGRVSGQPTTTYLPTSHMVTATDNATTTTYTTNVTIAIKTKPLTKAALLVAITNEINSQGDTADLSVIDISELTDISEAFRAKSTFNGDISSWDTSKITNMSFMFDGATVFNGDISGWNVDNVLNMHRMFFDAKAFNQDISGWVVDKVTDMSYMFAGTTAFNQDLNGWNVVTTANKTGMFENSGTTIPSWY